MFTQLVIQGIEKSAIKIGPPRAVSRNRMQVIRSSKIMISTKDGIEEIPIDGITTLDDSLYAHFKKIDNLESIIIPDELEERKKLALDFLDFIEKINLEPTSKYFPFLFLMAQCPKGLVCLSEGIQDALLSLLSEDKNNALLCSTNLGAQGPQYLAFALGSHLQFILTGNWAFPLLDNSPLNWRKARGLNLPLSQCGIQSSQEFQELLNSSFLLNHIDSFASLLGKFKTIVASENLVSIPIPEKFQKKFERKKKNLEKRMWWSKNSARIFIALGLLLILLIVPINILVKSLLPPITHGESPEQVASHFYRSLNEGDDVYLSESFEKGKAPFYVEEYGMKILNGRIRLGVERRKSLLSPDEYLVLSEEEKKRTDINVFGVKNLNISIIEAKKESFKFSIRGLWYDTSMQREENPNNQVISPNPIPFEDIMEMSYIRDSWLISKWSRKFTVPKNQL